MTLEPELDPIGEAAYRKMLRLMNDPDTGMMKVVAAALKRYEVRTLSALRREHRDVFLALAESWDDDFEAEEALIVDSLDPDGPGLLEVRSDA